DRGGQRPALDERHRQVRNVLELTHIVHRTDVRVVQGGGGPGLAVEPLPHLLVIVAQKGNLEGDRPVELSVMGAEYRSHPALAETVEDPVASEVPRYLVDRAPPGGR